MNKNKPIGLSKIPAWALKDCLNIIAEPLCFLINSFIEESRFPKHLKSAFVIPILKKGDCENAINHRPISITPALAKLFEKVLHEQISEYFSQHKLLSNTQLVSAGNFQLRTHSYMPQKTYERKLTQKSCLRCVPRSF